MEDTGSTDEKSIRRINEKGNPDVTVMTALREIIFTIILLNVASNFDLIKSQKPKHPRTYVAIRSMSLCLALG